MPDLAKIDAAVERLLRQEGMELVDSRWLPEGGRWVLRFYVDKPGGLTLADCEYLSARIGGLLDASDAVERSYVLEVSSPGLDRVLKKDADFVRFCGQRVRLRLRRPSEGCRNFQGTLGGLDDGLVAVETGGGLLRFPLSDIEEARLDPEVGV